ncbi:MAG: acyltransferase family protein [Pseudomonadota bacterium]
MEYRRDIDGLRAVAVLPVVFYHAGFAAPLGGFIGVDVFFVISGFLITSIVASEIADGRFSLLSFYERRARRILPALMAVMIATFAVSWFILMPKEMEDLGKSALSVGFFLSNVHFLSELDYFGPAAEFAPLLHTWSLAVEEQFYLFFPPLLMILAGRGWMRPVWAVAALSLASLVAAIAFLPSRPDWVFYLIFFRAWELGAGAVLALITLRAPQNRVFREGLALAGLAAILVPTFAYSSATAFPGLAALPPVLGAAILIWVGAHPAGSLVSHFLGRQPVVWIGLISYSLYLWHWPILALMRVALDTAELSTLAGSCAVILSFAMAWLSFRFIERPFRVRPPEGMGQRMIFKISAASLVLMIGVGAALDLAKGIPSRLPETVQTLVAFGEDRHPRSKACRGWPGDGQPCLIGAAPTPDGEIDFLLWGDSHADAMLPGMEVAAQQAGQTGAFLGKAGCPPLINVQRYSNGRICASDFSDSVLAWLQDHPSVSIVIMAARWPLYVEGTRPEGETGTDLRLKWVGAPREDLTGAENAAVVAVSFPETISRVLAMGRRVVLVGPIPEIGRDVPTGLARAELFGWTNAPSLTHAAHQARTARSEELLRELASADDQVSYIELSSLFCDAEICRTRLANGTPIYFDDDHVSATAAVALLPDRFQPIWTMP